ncbi:hypothetical protein LCGC14_1721590 [marine sediment metagenome]|uniref:CoA-binding domain-containing protein n=1 Tax=marine sediment metagenome TaxID=412755 RepID=A0A0F9HCB6_9ZZZZ
MSNEAIKPIKKVYLVFGPESSGNRMIACSFDTAGVSSVYSKNGKYIPGPHNPNYLDNPLLILMSLPHNKIWPDIIDIYRKVKSIGFEFIYLIFLDRKTDFMAKSQVFQDRVTQIERAYENIQIARDYMKSAIESLDITNLCLLIILFMD